MEVHKARDLIAMSAEAVVTLLHDDPSMPTVPMKIIFDDGELVTDNRKTIFSSFCWKIHRFYPETPVLKSHHMGSQRFTSQTNVDLIGEVYWDCRDFYGTRVDEEHLDRLAWEATNEIYVDAVIRLPEYTAHLCYDDYREVVKHPDIWQALLDVEPNRVSIIRCHDRIKQVLMSAKELSMNPLVRFVRSGFISLSQLLQCIAPKGYQTDIDSNYFEFPVMSSFLFGLRSLYESAIESRSATKAMYYSKDHVEKGEYFNRKMQLGCSVIQHLFPGDCGTTKYLSVKMTSERLKMFAGKYRVDGAMLVPVKSTDKFLIDKVIQVRSSIHCTRLHEAGICETCFGYMAKSVPRDSNLGFISSSELCKDASQAILSVKHDDHTSEPSDVVLGDVEQEYLEICMDKGNEIRLLPVAGADNMRLVVDGRYLRNLMDITVAKDLTELSLPNTSSIYDCELWFKSAEGFEQVVRLTPANGSRMASFTLEFLRYLVETKWDVGGDDRYIFDLSNWQYEDNIFVLPVKHANMIEFISDIETYIRSSGAKDAPSDRDRLINHNDLDTGLLNFANLVASKLRVNIAHLEIVVASQTARSVTDTRLPRCASEGVVMSYEELARTRSLGHTLAYEHLERIYGQQETYLAEYRQPHPMDALISP